MNHFAANISINPNIPGLQSISTTGPTGWIANFYTFALIISGIIAFGAIVYGGVLYASSAGNPGQQSKGTSWIWSSLLGMLLLAGAYLILRTVNPNLVNLTIPEVAPVPESAPAQNP